MTCIIIVIINFIKCIIIIGHVESRGSYNNSTGRQGTITVQPGLRCHPVVGKLLPFAEGLHYQCDHRLSSAAPQMEQSIIFKSIKPPPSQRSDVPTLQKARAMWFRFRDKQEHTRSGKRMTGANFTPVSQDDQSSMLLHGHWKIIGAELNTQ